MAVTIGADEFRARIALDDEELVATSPPIVVVDLAAETSPSVDVASVPAVLVGLGASGCPFADALDVVTDDERIVAAIERTVAATPRAAVALALLLRGRDGRTVGEALVAESTVYSLLQSGPEFAAWLAGRAGRTPPPDTAPPVLVEIDGERLRVTLNRPHRHNAYSAAIRDALVEALRLAIAAPELRIELDGAGPSFSSGGELAEFGESGDPSAAHLVRLTRCAARLLAQLSERVEVHVHGTCMGAGVELPAFARRVIADAGTTFALPEVGFGLIPGAGGTASLPPRIGRQRTMQLALTGGTIDAPTALEWGLVDELRG